MNIGVLGCGKLGLPLALTYASRGHEVAVWDVDDDVRNAVMFKEPLHYADIEPGVKKMRELNRLGILQPEAMGMNMDAVFIVVPTPSNHHTGEFSDEFVVSALNSLQHTTEHKVYAILVSTVSPGTCERIVQDLPDNIELVYAPTLIALGSVVKNLTTSATQIIGADDFDSGRWAAQLISTIAPNTPYTIMSYVSAELAKIGFNAFNTMKITFANIMGEICDQYPGADVAGILGTIGRDPRVGSECLTAGAGYGGPCFPRDNQAFQAAAKHIETLSMHVHKRNNEHAYYIADLALGNLMSASYAVIGREYKEGSEHEIESFGDALSAVLSQSGKEVDPLEAEVVVIAMPLRDDTLRGRINPQARVLDVWRTHGYLVNEVREYVAFGRPGWKRS